MKGVDVVFHLAALIGIPYSYQGPLSYVRTNVEGTLNVLEMARETGVGLVVHTSTSEVYGTALKVPMSEDHPLQGQSPYAATKIGADKLVEAYYRSYGLPVSTIRPFNTFGPRQSARAIIPTIITQALTQPVIRLGNLDTTRDFTYVADVVEGFVRIAETPVAVGVVTNVGSGSEISVRAMVAEVLKLMNRKLDIVVDEERVRPPLSEVERLCADTTRAKEILNWQPRFKLEAGLDLTIKWVEKNIGTYRSDQYNV
jgi:nucleoside-diphosphate-sugar epimerase